MKTTSEQLLARAEELEARARALRISAAEMNGHQTAEKRAKVGELFQAATKIRKMRNEVAQIHKAVAERQASQLPPLPKKKRYKPSELAPYVVAALDGATRTTVELRDLLAEQGAPTFGFGHVRQILLNLPQVTRAGGGRGTDVRWQLRKAPRPGSTPVGGRPSPYKWSPAQRKKFKASMKKHYAEKRAQAARGVSADQREA